MLECKTCSKTFTGCESYNQHIESEKHKKKMSIASKEQNSSSGDSRVTTSSDFKCNGNEEIKRNDNEEIKCKVCNLSFNSFENFEKHSLSPEHALKIMLSQSGSYLTPSSSSANNAQELNATKLKEEECVLPELNSAQSFSFANCSVCSKMFSGPEPYKQHMESQAHKRKVSLLQNSTSGGTNVILKCDPCEKSFSGQVPYAQHMSSETHKKKLQNIEFVKKYLSTTDSSNSQVAENKIGEKVEENKLWFCYTCNVQCSGLVPYEQHKEGSTHFKNAKRAGIQNNFMKMNNGVASMQQASNFSQGQISEKLENSPNLVNDNYQQGNEEIDDAVLPGKINSLKIVSCEELGEIVKVISPDEKINFDEDIKEVKNDNENGFGDRLKKEPEEQMKAGVYQTCKVCNVPLFDKDSAAEHYESKEHYEKRWQKQ